MTIDLHSRRSIRKITRADLAAFPVWEWAINEEHTQELGESLLRPTELSSLPRGLTCHYVVAATVTLNEGTLLPACVEVTLRPRKVQMAPMFILMQDRHLDFAGEESKTVLSHYLKRADARPVSWELAVPLDGDDAPRQGQIRRSLLARLAQRFQRRSSVTARSILLAP